VCATQCATQCRRESGRHWARGVRALGPLAQHALRGTCRAGGERTQQRAGWAELAALSPSVARPRAPATPPLPFPCSRRALLFVPPRPSTYGLVLSGMVFVLSGVFLQYPGGRGPRRGRRGVTALIASFGGIVWPWVTKETCCVVVGEAPGREKARARVGPVGRGERGVAIKSWLCPLLPGGPAAGGLPRGLPRVCFATAPQNMQARLTARHSTQPSTPTCARPNPQVRDAVRRGKKMIDLDGLKEAVEAGGKLSVARPLRARDMVFPSHSYSPSPPPTQ
jgi:hypothetical protein